MNRRTASILTTGLALTLAASLTACGGDDSGKEKDDGAVKGAEPAKTSAEASPSPSASKAGAERPKIELPADLKYNFEWPETGDKKKDAVMADAEQRIKAVDLAISHQDPADAAYRFYSEGEAAAGSEDFIKLFTADGNTITGYRHFYKPVVQLNDDGTAGFVYCEDQATAYNKKIKTGKVQKTRPSKDSYVVYNTRLRLDDRGIWVTEKLISQRGSATCQP
ncbi:hypothetical protein [Streptomyces sp. NPDC047046]|uniref:hypothetical protein n=1 Tax=Streptomyces sp. NPDC047046 TaxID=3155378 RepID=UPI003405DCF0